MNEKDMKKRSAAAVIFLIVGVFLAGLGIVASFTSTPGIGWIFLPVVFLCFLTSYINLRGNQKALAQNDKETDDQ